MTDAIDILINATDKASPAIGAVKSSLGGMNQSAQESHSIFSSVGSLLSGGVKAAAAITAVAVGSLAFAFRDSAEIAREHMRVESQLEAVLKSTGGAAGVSADMANKLADSLQSVTNFDGEATLSGENMLLTFTNIGKDVFPRATETMLDMSQALGQDLKGSAVQLGKALNDPIAGVSALSRVGVTFTDTQKDMIKTMVDAGDVAGAQTLILDELSKEFGGSARAMVEPGKQLENMWGDLKEQVGNFVIPIMDDLSKRAMPLVQNATAFLATGVGYFTDSLGRGSSFLDAFIDTLGAWAEDLDGIASDALFDLQGAFIVAFDIIRGRWDWAWDDLLSTAGDIWTQLSGFFVDHLPLWVTTLTGWAEAAWQWLVDATPKVIAQLANWYKSISTWVINQYPLWVATLTSWAQGLWQWIVDAIPKVLTTLGDWGGKLIGWFGAHLPEWISTFLEWETAIWQWIGDALPNAIKAITGFVRGLREEGDSTGGSSFGSMASGWAGKLWRWITEDLIPAVRPAFMRFVDTMVHLGMDLLGALADLAKELGLTLWKWIVDITPVALKALADWGGELWGWIKEEAPVWWDTLKIWAGMLWKWIVDVTPTVLKTLGEWAGSVWGWVKENAPKWYDQLKIWAGYAWVWIRDIAIPKALEQLGIWYTTLKEWLTTNWPKWRDDLIQRGKDAMQWLQDGIEIGWIKAADWFFGDTAFGRFVGDIVETFGGQLSPQYGVFYDHGKRIVYSLNDGSRYGLAELSQTGADMGNAISGGLTDNMIMHSPSRKMWGYGEDITAGLIGGVVAGVERVREAMNEVADAVSGVMRTRVDEMATVGQQMGQALGAGLKSEAQYIADQIKSTMALAAATYQGEVDTFARQAAAAAQAKYLAAVNAPKDVDAILRSLGIDPATWHLPITNLPYSSQLPGPAAPVIPTTTIGGAVGGATSTTGTAQGLLGGINLTTPDIAGAQSSADAAAKKVKDFIAGLGDFLGKTISTSTLSKVFSDAFDSTVGAPGEGYVKLQGAQDKIRQQMASLLGLPTIYGALDASGNLAALNKTISAGTDLNKVAGLLQSAVDFRTLANYYDAHDQYGSALPTDPRLTGQSKATTNQYNITIQGSNNANADVLGLVQMLGSLQGSATP